MKVILNSKSQTGFPWKNFISDFFLQADDNLPSLWLKQVSHFLFLSFSYHFGYKISNSFLLISAKMCQRDVKEGNDAIIANKRSGDSSLHYLSIK